MKLKNEALFFLVIFQQIWYNGNESIEKKAIDHEAGF